MGEPSAHPHSQRVFFFLISAFGVSIPFLCVEFPPATDLPQHLRQAQLIGEMLQGGAGAEFAFQWYTPYFVGYLVPLGWGAIADPIAVGSLTLIVLGLLWVTAVQGLARSLDRSPAFAALLCVSFFSLNLYWGFLTFLAGFAPFCLLFWYTTRGEERHGPLTRIAAYVPLFALLYYSHALWFAAGCAWLGLHWLLFRRTLSTMWPRLVGSAPAVIGASLWYAFLKGTNFQSKTVWSHDAARRASIDWLGATTVAPTGHTVEWIVFGSICVWVSLSLWTRRTTLLDDTELEPLAAGAMFLTTALVVPDLYQNTLSFASRWMPAALVFIGLAFEAPRIRPDVRHGFAAAVLTIFVTTTALRWHDFQEVDMAGMTECIDAMPQSADVLGLPYRGVSQALGSNSIAPWRPFLHSTAWLQLGRDGQLSFSFADFPVMPVVYSPPRAKRYTSGLEWYPQRVRSRDLRRFDFVLVGGSRKRHREFAAEFDVRPVTQTGVWRLYETSASVDD